MHAEADDVLRVIEGPPTPDLLVMLKHSLRERKKRQ